MDDCMSGDEECYYSDRETPDDIEDDETQTKWVRQKAPSCKVITRGSLLSAQKEDLRRVMDLLSLKEHHARTLLIHHRWDVEKVFAVFVEKGRSSLFTEAGLASSDNSNPAIPSTSRLSCDICLDDVSRDDSTVMDCGHGFCNACWTGYFIVKIDEGQSKRVRCMSHRCNAICDESIVRKLVGTRRPDLSEKFDRFLLESYIEDNRMVRWCPSVPHCGNAIRVEEGDEFCEVECSCGLQFCFRCASEPHSPCSCLMWELWSKKCRDESETVNWLMVHTKPCPKCGKPVEKNGGCNLVGCICGQAFCWLCGGATGREHTWSGIEGHSCGRYREDDKEANAKRAKRELRRYIHYHTRYKAHLDSMRAEGKLAETVKGRVSVSEERDPAMRDFGWAMSGLQRLFRSRRILCCSYPFGFYMFGEEMFRGEMDDRDRAIKQNLFEDQQQQLECNVERLSKVLEEPFEDFAAVKLMDLRMKVINLSVLIDSLCQKMYECVENDLLGSLQFGNHSIAPYRSKGIEKASPLSSCRTASAAATATTQGRGGSDLALLSGGDDGCSSSPRKRSKTSRDFDLNLLPQP